MASLQERLDAFKKSFESGAPPYSAPHEAIETMHRATEELRATGLEERAFKVDDHAPSFTLFNLDHLQVDSADLLRQGPLVISYAAGGILETSYRFSPSPPWVLQGSEESLSASAKAD